MLIFPVDHLPRLIPVGVQTSKGVEEIGFNVSAWLDKWPDMTFEVWPTRPTETAAYPAVCQLIGDVLVWYVSDADTAFEGLGTVEVVGIAEGIRKPSGPCATEIKKTSLGATKEPPEGIKPYYDDMMEAAKVIKENVDVGTSGLYIVRATPDPETYNIPRADRTQEEIRAAVAAGKTVLLVYSCVESAFVAANEGRVFIYAGEIVKDNGSTCPTFEGYLTYRKDDSDLLMYWKAYVKPGGTVGLQGDSLKTRTPHKLKLTGAVTAEFDGIEEVTVEIPQGGGVSDPGTAHQQLVSDADGKAVWVDRLAYKYTGQVDVLPETTLTYAGPEEDVELHLLTTPLPTMPEKGKTYNVVYNGTAYDCPVVYGYDEGGNGGQFILGNAMGEDGGNPDAPFTLIVLEDEEKGAEFGYYALCAALDGATSVTISITQEGTAYKTINEEYLPASAVRKPITLTVATDDTVTADTDFNAAWAMGAQALMDAIVIKHERADGIRTITPDNVELFENETGLRYIYIRYSSFYYDMADQSQIPDRGKWMLWHANALQIQSGILPGFNPMNLRTSGTAQAGDYVRYEGNGLLRLVSIDQLKADLGLTSGETTTEDVFYTSDGQTFTTLDGAVLHVQKGEE